MAEPYKKLSPMAWKSWWKLRRSLEEEEEGFQETAIWVLVLVAVGVGMMAVKEWPWWSEEKEERLWSVIFEPRVFNREKRGAHGGPRPTWYVDLPRHLLGDVVSQRLFYVGHDTCPM